MNPHNHLILIKGEDKTEEIASCKYNPSTKKYEVYYKGKNVLYPYGYISVRWLSKPVRIDHTKYKFFVGNTQLFSISEVICFEQNGNRFYRFFFSGNSKREISALYPQSKLKIVQSCLADQKSGSIMEYYRELSKYVVIGEDSEKSHLYSQFVKMDFVEESTVLATFLNPQKYPVRRRETPKMIFPFGCNESQRNAVEMALTHSVSIVEGPPGTGKTQTILNIIANLVMDHKTVAVVSNNNSATENVYEKLCKSRIGFLCARLGRKENKEEFLNTQTPANDRLSALDGEQIGERLAAADQLQKDLARKLTLRNELALLEQENAALLLEEKYFRDFYDETYKDQEIPGLKRKLSSKKLLYLWNENELRLASGKRAYAPFLKKLEYSFWYGIGDYHFFDRTVDQVIPIFQKHYYEAKNRELTSCRQAIRRELEAYSFDEAVKRLVQTSLEVLYGEISRRYRDRPRRIFEEEDLWKNGREIAAQYPVVLSTTHSIRPSLPQVIYDYVIVDEASQVDLLTGVLTMSCARNIVVVGDEKQLPNVVSGEMEKKARETAEHFAVSDELLYEANSLLTAVRKRIGGAPRVILREHYRCHPKIIQFCNQKFYNNELVIMSQDHEETDVLKVYKTVAGNHARRTVNIRQIDEIRENILPELEKTTAREEIGIISPYRAQTEKLDEVLEGNDIAVDTVHKFQGREKDAIIITTVDNQISSFTDNPNMLNVAVSRAKKKLRLVVSDNEANDRTNIGDLIRYVTYQKGEVEAGKVYSIFDLLYRDYKEARDEFLLKHKRVSAFESENLAYGMVTDFLQEKGRNDLKAAVHVGLGRLIRDISPLTQEQIAYAMNPWTHVDMVIYRTVDKSPVLAIEVDGYDFHKEGTRQHDVRDKMKDEILAKYEIPLLRFNTAGSGEKERLAQALERNG